MIRYGNTHLAPQDQISRQPYRLIIGQTIKHFLKFFISLNAIQWLSPKKVLRKDLRQI